MHHGRNEAVGEDGEVIYSFMNIIDCFDKDGIKVVCDEGTWYNHILAEHPEMTGCEEIIKATINNPWKFIKIVSPSTKRPFANLLFSPNLSTLTTSES